MLNKILGILGAVAAIFLTAVVTYYVNRSVPDVRYTLSEKIPVTFADPTNTTLETVQQLEVKNTGNAEANKIVVKIKGIVTGYKIYKYSAADSAQAFDQQQPIEFTYSQLPPQAGFKIVFKTASEGVEYGDVTISHSTGVAHEALAETGTNIAVGLGWGLLALYIIVILLISRPTMIDMWKFSQRDNSPIKTSQMGKPWHLFENEWKRIRSEIIKESFNKNDIWIDDIRKSTSYQFLSIEQPTHISTFEWKELTELAEKNLEKTYSYLVNKAAYSSIPIVNLLDAEKPRYFSQTQWNSLEETAIKQYVSIRRREYYSQEAVVKALKETRPDEISQVAWSQLTEYWEGLFYTNVISDLRYTSDPVKFIKKLDLSILSEKGKQALERDLDRHIKLAKETDKIEEITDMLDLVFNKKPLGDEKPEGVENWRWEQLKEMENLVIRLQEIDTLGDENESEAASLETERNRLSDLRKKIEHQLNFINELLNDPSKIERVEDYDDTFAVGNLANLKRVAQLLTKADGKK